MAYYPGFSGLSSTSASQLGDDAFQQSLVQLSSNTATTNTTEILPSVNQHYNYPASSMSSSVLPRPIPAAQNGFTDFETRMQGQRRQFDENREQLKEILANQMTNSFHINSRLGGVRTGQRRTDVAIEELKKDVLEMKIGIRTLLERRQTRSRSPAPSPTPGSNRSSTSSTSSSTSPQRTESTNTTTVPCQVTTKCCNSKLDVKFTYVPGVRDDGNKYTCSMCKKSVTVRNYLKAHVQRCIGKRGCPKCQEKQNQNSRSD